ncbi:MAG: carbohydrate porin [Hyphomonadaceae bacterium]
MIVQKHMARWALPPAALLACAAGPAAAEDAVSWSLAYTADVMAGASDDVSTRGRFLDNLDVSLDVDLAQAVNWRGATLHGHFLNNSGTIPNDDLGTLQGVDNIEVARHRARLFEFWVEQAWNGGSVRAGLYDLNSEFYANESAGLLIAPAFGIGSELAATGANGPSIFPSTAIAIRGRFDVSENSSVMVAVLNADAGVFGDPGGVDTSFDDGVLLIAEYEWRGPMRIAFGGWGYTEEQDDIRDTDGLGNPVKRDARGVYLTLEREIWSGATGFARIGVSDGDTTLYEAGWQAGVLYDEVFGRESSQLSFGAYQGVLSDKHRDNETALGVNAARAETGLELTYSEQVAPWLRVQPDVQLVLDPGGDSDRDELWVFGVRFEVTPFARADG